MTSNAPPDVDPVAVAGFRSPGCAGSRVLGPGPAIPLRPAILPHDPGLAASPPVRYTLKVERSGHTPLSLDRRAVGVNLGPPEGHRCHTPTPGGAPGRDANLLASASPDR